jgi:diguanylate cyclase (GGDEF)-like protein
MPCKNGDGVTGIIRPEWGLAQWADTAQWTDIALTAEAMALAGLADRIPFGIPFGQSEGLMTEKDKPMVVIIDDALMSIRLLEACLADEFTIRFATSGAAGLELIRHQSPDIVLLEVLMPDINGYELCAALKADPDTRDIPIVFVTALDEATEEAKGLSLGAVDYITKPFTPTLLKARVWIHIRMKRLMDGLQIQSSTDGLTGLANRQRFDEVLEREWRRAMRMAVPLSLIMIDIDNFRAFNDLYGHLGGDDCLRAVARALLAGVPRLGGYLVARYGGEEFVVVLVNTDIEGARVVGERLRANVAALASPHGPSHVIAPVTVSVGVASTIPERGTDPTALIEAADRMLYCAKSNGRNRVMG